MCRCRVRVDWLGVVPVGAAALVDCRHHGRGRPRLLCGRVMALVIDRVIDRVEPTNQPPGMMSQMLRAPVLGGRWGPGLGH